MEKIGFVCGGKSTSYPTDYPYYYNIEFGQGDSDDFFEYDWNSIALWQLKKKIEIGAEALEYEFPFGDNVKMSVEKANNDLIKYGRAFLNGDIELFLQTRSEQNKNREPYKITKPDAKGDYKTTYEPLSALQKKKYS